MKVEMIKQQLLAASRALVPAERVCIYSVAADMTPYDHVSDGPDPRWVERYQQFREIDPFHPRYFSQNPDSVFITPDARGPESDRQAFIQEFRWAMGIQYKAEVFLRDRRGQICAGIRFSRSGRSGDFRTSEIHTLNLLQPIFSNAWCSVASTSHEEQVLGLLTEREKEVLRFVQQGLPNKVICRELDVAMPTVKNHVKSILRKSGAANRTELIARLRAM